MVGEWQDAPDMKEKVGALIKKGGRSKRKRRRQITLRLFDKASRSHIILYLPGIILYII